MLHHVIWEEANGLIPEGCAVIFKDHDINNVTLENLELKQLPQALRQFPQELDLFKRVHRQIAKIVERMKPKGKKA